MTRTSLAFKDRVGKAVQDGTKKPKLYKIGEVIQPEPIPVVEGVWSVKGKTIVEVSGDSSDHECKLLDEGYSISDPDRTWFVVFVAPSPTSAERVRRYAGRLGFVAYWPRSVRIVRRGQGAKKREVPVVASLFPRYVLVHLPARGTPFGLLTSHEAKFNGVSGMVGNLGKPIAIADALVERIVYRELKGEFSSISRKGKKIVAKLPAWMHEGALAIVNSGPFAMFSATIEEIDEATSRVKVAVELFGRATPVELAVADLKPMC